MSTCKGKIIAVGEVRKGTSKKNGDEWASQQFVVEEQAERYPEHWVMDIFDQENIDKYDVHVGDEVEVSYDARSTEKDGRYYASNRPWKVEKK
jgi:hypothetical protein